ncbi:SLC13 family permease [Streptomyces sp. NPDC054796]
MSEHLIAIAALVLVFLLATVFSAHMGVLALVAAFVIGTAVAGESADDIFGGFPGDLFVVLVGVTYLFALAKNNGTVDWLLHATIRAVGGRIALIPWVMFVITALLTASGAVVPAAVGIIAPVALGFALRHRINPLMMGLLVINGAAAGGFSPISVYGTITNGVVSRNDLPVNPPVLFLCTFLFNALLCVAVFFLFGGKELVGRRIPVEGHSADGEGKPAGDGVSGTEGAGGAGGPVGGPGGGGGGGGAAVAVEPRASRAGPDSGADVTLDPVRVLTLVGLACVIAGSVLFDLDVGMMALSVSAVLALVAPASAKGALDQCAWTTVLLVCGIVTFVSLMERMGTIEWLGDGVAGINAPLLGALLICLIGAVVSAFASTTGILGALIPLAVPFLHDGHVSTLGMVIALALSSSVVDSSPFSTSGALVVANAPQEQRQTVFRRLMAWGMSMAVVAPVLSWGVFVLPL